MGSDGSRKEFGYKAGTLEAIENFVVMIKSFASMMQNKNAYEVATHVGKQTNIVKELFNDKTTEGLARYREHTGIAELNQTMGG